jgi:hypothetical protein
MYVRNAHDVPEKNNRRTLEHRARPFEVEAVGRNSRNYTALLRITACLVCW